MCVKLRKATIEQFEKPSTYRDLFTELLKVKVGDIVYIDDHNHGDKGCRTLAMVYKEMKKHGMKFQFRHDGDNNLMAKRDE